MPSTARQWRRWLVWMGAFIVLAACTPEPEKAAAPEAESTAKSQTDQQARLNSPTQKKVLYVNSYDLVTGSNWSLDVFTGALEVFNIRIDADLKLDVSQSPVELKIFNMKTKKNKTIEDKQRAALEAKSLIESWRPDVVICADDNASKYLIAPYFKDSQLPFVSCGVNWDASEYGFPCSNVTGMIEVFPVQEALDILRPYAGGDRVGFLSADTLSERKNAAHISNIFKVDLVERYANTMAEFEAAYKELQQACDILLVIDFVSYVDYSADRLLQITAQHTSIPTVAFAQREKSNFLLICERVPQEQGEWAARAAMEILGGKSPAEIPMAMNRRAGIRLNMAMAKKLGIKFPMELIERARFTSEEASQ